MWDRLKGWRGEEGDEGRKREDGGRRSTEESKRVSKEGGGEGVLGWVGKGRERKKIGGVREIVKWRG